MRLLIDILINIHLKCSIVHRYFQHFRHYYIFAVSLRDFGEQKSRARKGCQEIDLGDYHRSIAIGAIIAYASLESYLDSERLAWLLESAG